ncbi:MAG: DUF3000 domain-containing protein [Candidatus Nanopelagicales bacterium]
MTAGRHADSEPEDFRRALETLRSVAYRPELTVLETPAPQRLAPYAVALTAEVFDDDDVEVGGGRLVVLYDPDGVEAWEGEFRVVAFVKADLEPELASDPLLAEVGWSWLRDALALHEAPFAALGGTVTRTTSESYGVISDRPVEGQVEIRASWTPLDTDLTPHARAWAEVLALAVGLPPLPPGVTALPSPRSRRS